jgi:hypothetical protein
MSAPPNEKRPANLYQVDQSIHSYIDLKVAAAVESAFSRHIGELREFMQLGFPDGDLDGHRRYHEEQIEMMKAKRRMYDSIAEKTMTGLLWALIVAVGVALWEYASRRINT